MTKQDGFNFALKLKIAIDKYEKRKEEENKMEKTN